MTSVPPYTTPPTFATGGTVTAAQMNTYVRDNGKFFQNSPGCMAYRPSDQSIPDSTWTSEGMSQVQWDSDSITSAGTPSVFTINTRGAYRISATARFAADNSGRRQMRINLNSGTLLAQADNFSPDNTIQCDLNCNQIWNFSVGDKIVVEVYQNSGSGLNLVGSVPPLGYSIAINWVGYA